MTDTVELLRKLVEGATHIEGLRGIALGLVDIIEEKETEGTAAEGLVGPAHGTRYQRPAGPGDIWQPLEEGHGRGGYGVLLPYDDLQDRLAGQYHKGLEQVAAAELRPQGLYVIIEKVEK